MSPKLGEQHALISLREAHADVCGALPWLDASEWDGDLPAFSGYARRPPVGRRGFDLLRFEPQVAETAAAGTPLVVLHNDVEVRQFGELAARWPHLNIIIESGPIKLLYDFAELEAQLSRHPNLYLCTYNLCNWLGIERLCAAGLGERLLFGSHSPRYSVDAAMGPIALAHLPWERKCDLAGNNLRRLLGLPTEHPAEARVPEIAPFIVDAHIHSGSPGRFPVPDEGFGPEDWLRFMSRCCIERIFVVPFESLVDPTADPCALTEDFRRAAPGRVFFFEVFDPRVGIEGLRRLEESIGHPDCVGIKIHPSFHITEADDSAYEPVYDLAERRQVPILTHSWDVSATNPVQYMSHPSRFRPHLRRHPRVRLVLGHAGGRPGALDEVVSLCRDFEGVSVDLAGDYYDNGLVECLVDQVGASRVIFASDMNWVDPRCNLGPVLAAAISDEDALAILRGNALRVYPAVLRR